MPQKHADRRNTLVYVSGAITPTPHNPSLKENMLRINTAARKLFEEGYSVIAPIFEWFDYYQPYMEELKKKKYGSLYSQIIAMDLVILSRCDVIYMCRGWEHSRGCQAEHNSALENDLIVWYEQEAT